MTERVMKKRIDFYEGNLHDVNHFMKVHAYAEMIGKLEGLDEKTQRILELSAIVHDIACPLCRRKYGNADGKKQEAESEGLLLPFLAEFNLAEEEERRIFFLVTHHHTYTDIEGIDHRILLEADFLVNADEAGYSQEVIRDFCNQVFRTKSGMELLTSLYFRVQ